VDERTGRHTGFPVVHRIARKHSVGVRLAARPLPGSGTVAMVALPSHLLCEVPADKQQRRPAPAAAAGPAAAGPVGLRPTTVTELPHGEPARPHHPVQAQPAEPSAGDQFRRPAELRDRRTRQTSELPRRERGSLRGAEPRRGPRDLAPPPTPQQQSAARRAFAEELSAFSQGASLGDLHTADDTALKQEARQ